jgi:hypothetical protein
VSRQDGRVGYGARLRFTLIANLLVRETERGFKSHSCHQFFFVPLSGKFFFHEADVGKRLRFLVGCVEVCKQQHEATHDVDRRTGNSEPFIRNPLHSARVGRAPLFACARFSFGNRDDYSTLCYPTSETLTVSSIPPMQRWRSVIQPLGDDPQSHRDFLFRFHIST